MSDAGDGVQDVGSSGARFGRYRIVRRIGHGSFGTVYEGRLSAAGQGDRRVAIKKLRDHLVASEPEFVRSMANEARIGALLDHPNVVRVLQFGRQRRHYYLTMEFVDGADLSQLIQACREQGVGLPRFAVLDLARQVCRGLAHAHGLTDDEGTSTELVHRDIKPSNVLVDRQGLARISDFGVARSTTNLFTTTLSGVVKGTPRYMSPEQVSGSSPLTHRSDLFSVGAVLFEMITGRYLFDGVSMPSLARAIMFEDLAPSLDDAEDALPGCRPVLERMLCRDPATRYRDASEVDRGLMELARAYPAESSLADVLVRLLPLVDRSDSIAIDDTAALQRDLAGVDDSARSPAPVAAVRESGSTVQRVPQAASWNRFTAAFDVPPGVGGDVSEPARDGKAPSSHRAAWIATTAMAALVLGILVMLAGPCGS